MATPESIKWAKDSLAAGATEQQLRDSLKSSGYKPADIEDIIRQAKPQPVAAKPAAATPAKPAPTPAKPAPTPAKPAPTLPTSKMPASKPAALPTSKTPAKPATKPTASKPAAATPAKPAALPTSKTPAKPAAATPKKKGGMGKILIILAIIAVLVVGLLAVGIAAFFFLGSSSQSSGFPDEAEISIECDDDGTLTITNEGDDDIDAGDLEDYECEEDDGDCGVGEDGCFEEDLEPGDFCILITEAEGEGTITIPNVEDADFEC